MSAGKETNSILCVGWVHKRCSGIKGKLKSCQRFLEEGPVGTILRGEIEPNVKLECLPKFCYLSDTFSAGGGADGAASARMRCAWAKFKELSPIMTTRGSSYHMKEKISRACVR